MTGAAATDNSYLLDVDGANCYVVGDNNAMPAGNWTWVDYQNGTPTSKVDISLSAGNHTFKMIGREDDVKLDRILLASDLTCTPAGTGDTCVASGTCPFGTAYADGCSTAPTGTPQYPNMLNGYLVRPPWNVAGVDYHVGVPTGTALTPWRNASATNASFNLSSGMVSCTTPGANVTLNAIDFSPASGVSPFVYDSQGCTWTISNSKFTCPGNYTNIVADNLTLTSNEFDQNGCPNAPSSFINGGNITLKYNWFRRGWQHVLETGGPDPINYQYNLIDDMVPTAAANAGSHENWQQLYGTSTVSADTIMFNTSYEHTSGYGAAEGFQFYCNSGPCTIKNPILSNNTMIALAGTGRSYSINAGGPNYFGPIVNGTNNSNYFDLTGAFGAYYPNTVTPARNWSSSGNINMSNGKIINPVDNSESSSGDLTPPTVSLSVPANGATIVGNATISATASDNVSVAGVRFKVDGNNIGAEDVSSPYSISWDSTLVSNGAHTLTAVARDGSGNATTSSSVSITVNNPVDTTAPTISLTAPTAGATLSNTAALSATASDNVSVAGVQFKVDGANVGAEDVSSPYSITWDSSTVANGSHTVTAVARDGAGNTKTSTAVNVTVSNTLSAAKAAYPFTEGTGTTTADTSGNSNTATLNGATWSTAGKYGKALSFNGTSAYASAPDAPSLDISGSGSIEAWVELNSLSKWHGIIAKGAANSSTDQNYAMEVTSADVVECSISDGTNTTIADSTTTLTTTAFYHLACTWDGTNLKIYINGTLNKTTPQTITPAGNTLPLNIGQYGGADFTSGTIDDIRIYARALSSAEITTDMNTAIDGATTDATPPTVSMTAPAGGATVNGANVTVSANASDNVGVAGVQFQLDCPGPNCGLIGAEDLSNPYSINWDTTGITNGTHTLAAVARDAAGNITTATAVTVTVNNATPPPPDTTPPTTPGNLRKANATSTSIVLAWNASTDTGGAGVRGYRLFRGGSFITEVQTGLTYTDSGLTANTSYSYKISAIDNAGNESAQSATFSVTTNANPPTASLSASPTAITSGNSSTLTWTSTNATSCAASGAWSGTKAVGGGTQSVSPTATSTYNLACSGTGGSSSASATVTVNSIPPPPPPPPPGVTGDLNGDGHVNIFDLSILLSHYGQAGTGDIDSSGSVNIIDLSLLLSHYGQ